MGGGERERENRDRQTAAKEIDRQQRQRKTRETPTTSPDIALTRAKKLAPLAGLESTACNTRDAFATAYID